MHSIVEVVTPANDISLLTLYEARLALNITTTDSVLDEKLEMLIRWASDEIASMCNRVFARETVIETVYEIDPNSNRMILSHYPVGIVTNIDDGDVTGLLDTEYKINSSDGMLHRRTGTWTSPVVVSYTGGYDLPFGAPQALRSAALMMTREAYYAGMRGDATVRMVSHKESRIIYFDPNSSKAQSSGGSSAATRAVSDLLKRYMRIVV